MSRGRPKKPAEISLKQGNPGRRSRDALDAAAAELSPADDAVTTTATFEPPPSIADDPQALPIWNHIVDYLARRLVLKQGDIGVVSRYAQNYVIYELLRASLRDRRTKGGLRLINRYVREGYGTVEKTRPEWRMLMEIQREMRADETVLGLSPSSRAAVMSRLATAREGPVQGAQKSDAAANPDAKRSGLPAAPASPIGLLASTAPPAANRKH